MCRRIAIFLAFCFMLVSCASSSTYCLSSGAAMQKELERRGVTVVVLGDQVLMVMPSSLVFERYSPRILPSSYSTLNLVTAYINNYTKTLVTVTAYTNNSDSRRVDLALSKEQARSIIRYLENAGVDARLLYANGRGGRRLVEKNSRDWDFSLNNRIEITFEKLYV